MARQFIDLDRRAFIMVNGPLIFLILTANIFYAYCLCFPLHNQQRLKQPLKTLLGILVGSSVIYCVSLGTLHWQFHGSSINDLTMAWTIVLSYMQNSLMCSAWLNFFYTVQIVPSQRTCLIWMKRNIKTVIFTVLLFSGTLFLFGSATQVASLILSGEFHELNGTWTTYYNNKIDYLSTGFFVVMKCYSFFCFCVMMGSSFSTVYYLHMHMRSVSRGSSGFSRQKIRSQIRVSITGISQGVFYLVFDIFNVLETFVNNFSHHIVLSAWISFTVTSLYVTGTTVNLGIGQTAFRLRMVNIWKTIKAMFRGGGDLKACTLNIR